jgi:hypothetical protein
MILGNGAVLDGKGSFFYVRNNAVLALNSLTLQNGTVISNDSSPNGGAVKNEGTLTLNHTNLISNQAGNGGAIFNGYYGGDRGVGNANHGVLKVNHSSFISNSANNGYGAAGGGAIYNMYGDITVAHSSFASNAGANGGAIYNSFHASAVNTVIVVNSNFTSNEANVAGGAIWNGASLTVLLGTVFTNNAGGGLFVQGPTYIYMPRIFDNIPDNVAGVSPHFFLRTRNNTGGHCLPRVHPMPSRTVFQKLLSKVQCFKFVCLSTDCMHFVPCWKVPERDRTVEFHQLPTKFLRFLTWKQLFELYGPLPTRYKVPWGLQFGHPCPPRCHLHSSKRHTLPISRKPLPCGVFLF